MNQIESTHVAKPFGLQCKNIQYFIIGNMFTFWAGSSTWLDGRMDGQQNTNQEEKKNRNEIGHTNRASFLLLTLT